jgi:hypothetical protein
VHLFRLQTCSLMKVNNMFYFEDGENSSLESYWCEVKECDGYMKLADTLKVVCYPFPICDKCLGEHMSAQEGKDPSVGSEENGRQNCRGN